MSLGIVGGSLPPRWERHHNLCMVKIKLVGPLLARSPRLRLRQTFALEIERHGSADEILQGRLMNLVAFVDVDGAADVPVEAGVKQARGVLQRSSSGKCHLDDVLVRLSCAEDAAA